MRKFFLLSIILLSFTLSDLFSQKITVNAALDSTMIWIGNQAQLSFEVSQKPNQKVIMPIFSDTIVGGLELVEPVKTDTVKSADGQLLVTQRYKVTAYEDSLLYIPPFPFVSGEDTVWSKSLSLKVVQPFEIDTAANSIADIKSVFEPKFYWMGLFQKILIVLLICALLIVIFLLVRKYYFRKTLLDNKETEKLLPPDVVAINLLNRIKQEKPWQQGRSKEYHTELTEILREYTERVFGIRSLEMTSDEILEQLKYLYFEKKSAYICFKQILQLADLVKFAKWNPTPDEHELSLYNAYLFVNQTKIEEVKPLEEIRNEEQSAH